MTNVVHARPDLPGEPWLVSESAGLELLYRMADFCRPDWVIMADDRMDRVRLYQRLDPDNAHNFGAAYDRALLFGYRLDELDQLKADYARCAAAGTTGTTPV